ncbi:hypothetical protein RI054_18g82120 [Pseudoscourfieldia marina]
MPRSSLAVHLCVCVLLLCANVLPRDSLAMGARVLQPSLANVADDDNDPIVWDDLADLTTPRDMVSAACAGGVIYVVGGQTRTDEGVGSDILNSVEALAPANGTDQAHASWE